MELCSCFMFRWFALLIFLASLLLLQETSSEDVPQNHVTCDNVSVENGAVFLTKDEHTRDRIIVDCDEGYVIQGSAQLHCIADMSSLLPVCVEIVQCRVECHIEHGSCTDHDTGYLINPGDVVKYECNETFSADYTSIRCTEKNGSFDHLPPNCVRKSQGIPCSISESEAVSNFLIPSSAQTVQAGESMQVTCEYGYLTRDHEETVTMECRQDGTLDRDHRNLCLFVPASEQDVSVAFNVGAVTDSREIHFVNRFLDPVTGMTLGVDFTIDFNADSILEDTDEKSTLDQGVEVSMTCTVHSLTTDGLPLPEVTWQCPSKLLTEYVDDGEGDMVHATFIDGVTTEYKVIYEYDKMMGQYIYQAEATLTILSTREVHSGTYLCQVKLVDFVQTKSKSLEVKSYLTPAMWLLLILPVVMFVAVHCFYRKAIRNGRNPFQSPNKIDKDIMQEVDRKKKLEELHLQYTSDKNKRPSVAPTNKSRGRRGAVIDV